MTYTCSRCGDIYTEVLSAIGHAYPLTWTENGEGVDGKHVKVCANDPSHIIEESHVFLGEETYYSKQVGTWTNASGTDTRALVDVFWGRYCEKCGWVHIHDVERTDTENNLVTDFDQLYRLLTYGYSVKLANDITVPATGNTAQRGSNETAGYKSVVINQGTFRGFSNP
jgi:hypothetical protein